MGFGHVNAMHILLFNNVCCSFLLMCTFCHVDILSFSTYMLLLCVHIAKACRNDKVRKEVATAILKALTAPGMPKQIVCMYDFRINDLCSLLQEEVLMHALYFMVWYHSL